MKPLVHFSAGLVVRFGPGMTPDGCPAFKSIFESSRWRFEASVKLDFQWT